MPTAYEIYTNGLLLDAEDPAVGPNRLYKFQNDFASKIAKSKTGTLKQFFVSDSLVSTAKHTRHKVRGAAPDCGPGVPSLDDQAKEYIKFLNELGTGLDKTFDTGYVFRAITDVISFVAKLTQKYQTDANCAFSSVVVPASIQDITELTVSQYVGFGTVPVISSEGERAMPDGWGDWMHLETPVLSSDVFHLDKAKDEDPLTECGFRLVSSCLRNWSRSRDVSFRTRVSWDADNTQSQCVDFTMTSEAYRKNFFDSIMDNDLLQGYAAEYYREAQTYTRIPPA